MGIIQAPELASRSKTLKQGVGSFNPASQTNTQPVSTDVVFNEDIVHTRSWDFSIFSVKVLNKFCWDKYVQKSNAVIAEEYVIHCVEANILLDSRSYIVTPRNPIPNFLLSSKYNLLKRKSVVDNCNLEACKAIVKSSGPPCLRISV